MLREARARSLAFVTTCVVVGLAALFAWLRNPAPDAARPPAVSVPSAIPIAVPSAVPMDAPTPPMAGSPPDRQAVEPPRTQAAPADDPRILAGRAAFVRLNCTRCHAIDGAGNSARPLDGVGSRLDATALRDWTLGTGPAREELSAGTARAKARAADDPDIDVLIDYLAQSR